MVENGISSSERLKKEKEKVMIKEGTELWKRKKIQDAVEKREDQRRLQAMLSSYHPWGRPGHGAPNNDVRRKPLNLVSVEKKRGLETSLPRWGGGAKPAPSRRSDPILRYQLHEPVRKSIENHVRYRRPYQEQLQYKQQLDRLVAEKRRLLNEERREDSDFWNMTLTAQTPWGKPGPGGCQWREPRAIGLNFLHSLGWTGEPTLQRLEYQHLLHDEQRAQTPRYPMLTQGHITADHRSEIRPPEESLTGGVELVPLLARRRLGYRRKDLSSTDVTRMTNGKSVLKPVWKQPVNEREYLRELTTQIINKEMQIKEARSEDIVKSKRHFETWGGFWGRPGHGAPKGNNYKENLDSLLYRIPVATV
ncbi:uncharacterized protein LOC128998685 isoform X1 [Macrosteles quadrilineatus]|uniref:uncharacterized protein LOC128998685 isoform X1 n=1 Tax=Macrosteles quadrilineatus TaxID=74068 RepID=UPI0023E13686|nr:uncharacterized protein LOC128998685 isoform X1 [Macrosteles quadrilineatus]